MKSFVKVLLSFMIITTLLFFIVNNNLFTSIRNGDFNTVSSLIGKNTLYLLFISFGLMFIQSAFSIIPVFLMVTLNNTLLGYYIGFFWSLFSSIVTSVIVFLGIRYIFKDYVMKKTNPTLLNRLGERGLIYVIQVRIFPFIPTNIINGIAGVSAIGFRDFLVGTTIGNSCYMLVLTLVQAGVLAGNWDKIILIIITILPIISYFLLKKFFYRRKQKRMWNSYNHS